MPDPVAEPTQQNFMDLDELQGPDLDNFNLSDLGLDEPEPAAAAQPEPEPKLEPEPVATPEPEPAPVAVPRWQQMGFGSLEDYTQALEVDRARREGLEQGARTATPRQSEPRVEDVIAAQEAKLIARLKQSHGMPDGGEGFVQEILNHMRGENDFKLSLQERRHQEELNALREPMSQVFDRLSIMQEAPPEVQKAQEEAIYMQNALIAAGLPKDQARATTTQLFKSILAKNAQIAAAATGPTPTQPTAAPTPPSPNLKVVASRPKMPSADEAPPEKGGDDSDFLKLSAATWDKWLGIKAH